MTADPYEDSQTELVESLEEYVQPFQSEAPATSLETIDVINEEVDVIGIGERSHGIRECIQTWRHLVNHFVEEYGIRTICCELNMFVAVNLDDYIRNGEGSAENILSGNGLHPNWKSESALEFVEWLRDFNRNQADDDKVRIYGLDYTSGRPIAQSLSEYLQQVDPEYFEKVSDELQYFTEKQVDMFGQTWHQEEVDPDAYAQRWEEIASSLKHHIENHTEEFIEKTSKEEYKRIKRGIKMFDFTVESVSKRWNRDLDEIESSYEMRAEYLADTCQWVYDNSNQSQMIILAHNSHIRQGNIPIDGEYIQNEIPSMMARFSESTNTNTVSIGLTVRGGEFRTVNVSGERRWENIDIPDPEEGSFSHILSEVSDGTTVIDISTATEDSELAGWFDHEPEIFILGTVNKPYPVYRINSDLRVFDVVISVKNATPLTDLAE